MVTPLLMVCALDPRRPEQRMAALLWLMKDVVAASSPTLVFAATRHHVELLHALLEREGLPAACVYGQMDQVPRLHATP